MERTANEGRQELRAVIDELVDAWCERRALGPLRRILRAWPSPLRLTDDWGLVREELRLVLALAREELAPGEADDIQTAITAIDIAMDG